MRKIFKKSNIFCVRIPNLLYLCLQYGTSSTSRRHCVICLRWTCKNKNCAAFVLRILPSVIPMSAIWVKGENYRSLRYTCLNLSNRHPRCRVCHASCGPAGTTAEFYSTVIHPLNNFIGFPVAIFQWRHSLVISTRLITPLLRTSMDISQKNCKNS